jgi:hypothetical protein
MLPANRYGAAMPQVSSTGVSPSSRTSGPSSAEKMPRTRLLGVAHGGRSTVGVDGQLTIAARTSLAARIISSAHWKPIAIS